MGISVKGGAVIGGGSISQEVRPEFKMATNSQNVNIIILSELILFLQFWDFKSGQHACETGPLPLEPLFQP
jgi:hypothetical protein